MTSLIDPDTMGAYPEHVKDDCVYCEINSGQLYLISAQPPPESLKHNLIGQVEVDGEYLYDLRVNKGKRTRAVLGAADWETGKHTAFKFGNPQAGNDGDNKITHPCVRVSWFPAEVKQPDASRHKGKRKDVAEVLSRAAMGSNNKKSKGSTLMTTVSDVQLKSDLIPPNADRNAPQFVRTGQAIHVEEIRYGTEFYLTVLGVIEQKNEQKNDEGDEHGDQKLGPLRAERQAKKRIKVEGGSSANPVEGCSFANPVDLT